MDTALGQTRGHDQSDDTSAWPAAPLYTELTMVTHDVDANHHESREKGTLQLQTLPEGTNGRYQEDEVELDDKKTQAQQDDKNQNTGDDEAISCYIMFQWHRLLKDTIQHHRQVIGRVVGVVVMVLYLAYTCYALYRQRGKMSATRLWVLLVVVLQWLSARPRRLLFNYLQRMATVRCHQRAARLRKIARRTLYVVALVGAVVYLVLEVVNRRPGNLISLVGIAFLFAISLLLSTDPQLVNWHTVFWGFALQFYLAIFTLRTQTGMAVFSFLGNNVKQLMAYTDKGSQFLFGEENYLLHPFVFKSMPVLVFLSALIAVAYHFGIIQAFIATSGRFLSFCLGTTPLESVNAATNVILGPIMSSLVIKPFLITLTDSELFAIMTGGLASISGLGMALIISFGIPAEHILVASVMSVPAALAIAKIMCPEKKGREKINVQDPYQIDIGQPKNLLEAVSQAGLVGVALLVNICANMLIFIAFIALSDDVLVWFGKQAGVNNLSFTRLLSYLFYPLMYLTGVDSQDLLAMGRLVGVKFVTNVVVGYSQVGKIIRNSRVFSDYLLQTNGTWQYHDNDITLNNWNQTLTGGVLTDRSVVLSTYIMCGYCSISSLAITVAAMSALVPQRTKAIVKYAVRTCIAANLACFLTGCVAGLLYV